MFRYQAAIVKRFRAESATVAAALQTCGPPHVWLPSSSRSIRLDHAHLLIQVVDWTAFASPSIDAHFEATTMTYVPRGLPPRVKVRQPVRWPVSIAVKVSGSGLGHHVAEMRDLSRGGCLIRMQCRFAAGDLMLVTVPTLGPLSARVDWSSGTETRLEFVEPLSSAVLETIVGRHRRRGAVEF